MSEMPTHQGRHICKAHKPKHRPKLAKELHLSNPRKIELKKSSSPSENKKFNILTRKRHNSCILEEIIH